MHPMKQNELSSSSYSPGDLLGHSNKKIKNSTGEGA